MQKTKDQARFNHGLHNEIACDHLFLKEDLTDWVVTTAFYSSLHFVTYQVFPFDMQMNGKRKLFNNIEEYYSFKQTVYSKASKHDLLVDLVHQYCSKIGDAYEWLYNAASNARYRNYQLPKEYGQKAKSNLLAIKKHCMPHTLHK